MTKDKNPGDNKVISIVDKKPVTEDTEIYVDPALVEFADNLKEQILRGEVEQVIASVMSSQDMTGKSYIAGETDFPEIAWAHLTATCDSYKISYLYPHLREMQENE